MLSDDYPYLDTRPVQHFQNALNFLKRRDVIVVIVIAALLLLVILLYIGTYTAPREFPRGEIVIVEDGASLEQVAQDLSDRGVIRSPLVFRSLVIMMSAENAVQAGHYMFNEKINVRGVALRIVNGEYDIPPQKITVPEGTNVYEIATLLDEEIDNFDVGEFLKIARDKEGYLFPDTYFFAPGTDAKQVVDIMEHTFWKRLDEVNDRLASSTKSTAEIIIMASIIEREAYNSDERRMISGILWKRIDDGMPLQVDATFSHVNGKNSFTLTLEDLTSTSSPYNTYTNLGLPPGPISNPGLDSIIAALEPEKSPYYFYLHGRDGEIRYAETFDGHKVNRKNYLD